MQLTPTRISAVIDSALEATGPVVDAAGHVLSLHLPSYGLEVNADAGRLSKVLSNLIENAAKHTPPGGHIAISVELAQDNVVVTVADDGIGMDPAEIEGMFDIFTQASGTPGRSNGGPGTGLALSRSIVQLHGGQLSASSAGPGKGSEFRFSLPLLRATTAREAAVAAADATPGATRAAGDATVLVADDNADAAWGIAKLLEMSGFKVMIANNGSEALDLALRHKPQVALLDLGMPDIDGHEVARRVRAQGNAQMVLIAATGRGQDADVRESLAAGFDAHLTKPVDVNHLRALMAQQLSRR
ncbi:MAG: response regulator [Variovorax sp.]|nr:MAG: response regulator [Variovorax sp.]